MDLSKSYEFFQPDLLKSKIHIIGCGSVGSTVAENLARFGIENMVLYDFDKVEPHNLANQMFSKDDIGMLKTEAVAKMIEEINPDTKGKIKLINDGWHGQKLAGYVFLCVDSIELRREIVESCKGNEYVKAFFDFRTRLTDAQHYATDWADKKMVQAFINSMAFSHEEAAEETPVSACNVTLSVAPTVRMICAAGVSNFINFVKSGEIKKFIQLDAFSFLMEAF
jgi:siroheme synthase (precorrin-2 oxidase/ferrochelatase)